MEDSLDGPVAALWRRYREGQLSPAILGYKEGGSVLCVVPPQELGTGASVSLSQTVPASVLPGPKP